MKKQLQVIEPCHENWDAMTPQEQGRHCEQCDIVVVDFTDKSREEIAAHIESKEGGRVCGRFNNTQLDVQPERNWMPKVKAAAASVLAAAGLATDGNATEATSVSDAMEFDGPTSERTNQTQVIIRGSVRQTTGGDLIKGARVNLFSGGKLIKSMTTGSEGTYVFEVQPGELANNKFSVRIFAKGEEPKILSTMEADKYEITLNTVMQEYYSTLGVVSYEEPVVQHNQVPVVRVINEVEEIEEIIEEEVIEEEVIVENVEMPDVEPPMIEEEIVYNETIDIEETIEEEIIEEEAIETTPEIRIEETETELEEVGTLVFPNPTSDVVNVQMNEDGDYTYNVYDLDGRMVFNDRFQGSQLELNFSGEERGTYIINIYSSDELVHSGRIIVSR